VHGSLDLRRVGALLQASGLGFTPVEARILVHGDEALEVPYDETVWERIATTPDAYGFELNSGLEGPSVSCGLRPVEDEVMVSETTPDPQLVETLAGLPGLLGGASGDFEDARWQGETSPNHYRMWFDGPWEQLPRTIDPRTGKEIIDVSGNPGRITDLPGMRLWAAQDLWFGPASALLIDHDAIATLPVGRVTDLGGGRYHVRLWEDGTSLDDIRKAQQTLRDHLRYDAAAARQDEIRSALTADQPDDPMVVVQDGSFPHGGTRRVLQYYSATKHPTTRSRAAWLTITEVGDDNGEVHDEIVDLTTQPHPDLG